MIDLPSAKDTLLQRHTGVSRVYLRGDPRIAEAYLGRAKVYMGWLRNALALGGVNAGARHINLENGVKIRVLFDGAMNVIEIYAPPVTGGEEATLWTLFLESAFLDVRPVAPEAGDDLPAGKVYYLQPQLDNLEVRLAWLDTLEVEGKVEGVEGKVAAQAEPFSLRPYTPGMASEGVPEDSGKRFAYAVPVAPSSATGKLKLLLQAWAGSDRQDVVLSGLSFLPTVELTVGLHTTEELEYYLLTLTRTTVTATPLTLSSSGKKLRQYLLDVRDQLEASEVLKIEAYLLSTATLDDWGGDSTFEVAQFTGITGFTFYYGWKLNWSGTQGSLCTYEMNEASVTSFRYAFNVTSTPDQPRPFEIALSLEETEEWTPRPGIDLLWVPYWPELVMELVLWPTPVATLLEADAPVYSYYDSTDQLVVIRHQYALTAGSISTAQRNAVHAIFTCDLTLVEAALDQTSSQVDAGFYTDILPALAPGSGVPLTGPVEADAQGRQLSGVYDWQQVWGEILNPNTLALECVPYNFALPTSMCAGQPWTDGLSDEDLEYCTGTKQHYQIGTGNAISHSRVGNLTEAYDSALVIPWACSEAAYLVKQQYRRESGTQNKYGYDVVLNNVRPVSGETRNAKIQSPVSLLNLTRLGGGLGGGGAYTQWLSGAEEVYENRLEVDLIHKTGTVRSYEAFVSQSTPGGKEAEFGLWVDLLDPVFGAGPPTFPFMFWVIPGIQGDLMYLGDASQAQHADRVEKTTPLIPLETFDGAAFVGWA